MTPDGYGGAHERLQQSSHEMKQAPPRPDQSPGEQIGMQIAHRAPRNESAEPPGKPRTAGSEINFTNFLKTITPVEPAWLHNNKPANHMKTNQSDKSHPSHAGAIIKNRPTTVTREHQSSNDEPEITKDQCVSKTGTVLSPERVAGLPEQHRSGSQSHKDTQCHDPTQP